MKLVDFLTQFNLNQKEAKLYLASLGAPGASIRDLIQLTGLPRSTVAFELKSLVKKGVVLESKKGKRRVFIALRPEKFLAKNKKALDELSDILPELQARTKQEVEAPVVRLYNYVEGLKSILDEMLEERPSEFRCVANADVFASIADRYFVEELREKRFKAGVSARLLLVNTKEAQKLARVQRKYNCEIRFVPKEFPFESEFFSWNNKVLLIQYLNENVITLVVENDAIAQLMKSMFEMLWRWSVRE